MGDFMNSFINKSGCEITYLATSFANVLAQGLTSQEIALMSSFLVAVGDNLAILAIQCIDDSL